MAHTCPVECRAWSDVSVSPGLLVGRTTQCLEPRTSPPGRGCQCRTPRLQLPQLQQTIAPSTGGTATAPQQPPCPGSAPAPRLEPAQVRGGPWGRGSVVLTHVRLQSPRSPRSAVPQSDRSHQHPARRSRLQHGPGGARCRPMAPCGPGDTADEPRTIGAMPARARVSPRSP